MKFGYFDDLHREYVIAAPRTPLPWINYLGSEDYFALVSNTGGGYSFYRDARLRRLTRYRYNNSPLDSDGFHVYVRDGNDIWNIGWQPVKAELYSYRCRHGLGYTVLEGERNGLYASQELFVPRGTTVCSAGSGWKTAAIRKRPWISSPTQSSVSGTPWTTAPTSSGISAPARWRSSRGGSITRLSTGSGGITTPCSGPTGSPKASTPPGTLSWAFTAPRPCPRRLSGAYAPTAWPMAGPPWPPCRCT